jgi:FkbM family methyltransferase
MKSILQTRPNMNKADQFEEFLQIDLPSLAAKERTAFDQHTEFHKSIAIYGCGNLGRKLAGALRDMGMPAIAFVDGNRGLWGKTVTGLPVYSIDEAARLFGRTAVIVVAVWSPGPDRRFDLIRNTLQAAGCENVVHFLPLFWKYAETLLPHYRLDLPSRLLTQRDLVTRAFQLFEDESSRSEFLVQLKWMLLGEAHAVPPGDPIEDTYFPTNLFRLTEKESFVDCGAFDGDTLRSFFDRTNRVFDAVVAYEPDPTNYIKLNKYIHSLPTQMRQKICIEQCALGSVQGVARFEAMGSVSSSITTGGSIEVSLQRLDDSLQDVVPTYIKIDIEGAEVDALKGGEGVIQHYHPKLAVCVYHTQDHLWQIPLEIKRLNPDSSFYLRRYDHEFGDVVCYSLPRQAPSR